MISNNINNVQPVEQVKYIKKSHYVKPPKSRRTVYIIGILIILAIFAGSAYWYYRDTINDRVLYYYERSMYYERRRNPYAQRVAQMYNDGSTTGNTISERSQAIDEVQRHYSRNVNTMVNVKPAVNS